MLGCPFASLPVFTLFFYLPHCRNVPTSLLGQVKTINMFHVPAPSSMENCQISFSYYVNFQLQLIVMHSFEMHNSSREGHLSDIILSLNKNKNALCPPIFPEPRRETCFCFYLALLYYFIEQQCHFSFWKTWVALKRAV